MKNAAPRDPSAGRLTPAPTRVPPAARDTATVPESRTIQRSTSVPEAPAVPAFPCFFAAANAARGFTGFFEPLFGEGSGVERLYVLKGGPGTGKSRFLRDAAQAAMEKGCRVITYACSSDPSSLDGLRISGAGLPTTGIIDGTAPHAWEISCPGVREELIDLGAFWRTESLRSRRDAITALAARKADAYARAYRWLSAAGDARRVRLGLLERTLDRVRFDRCASRLLRGGRGGEGKPTLPGLPAVGLHRACGMRGEARTDGMERLTADCHGGRVVCVGDNSGLGTLFLDALRRQAEAGGLRFLRSPDPLLTENTDGLLLPDVGLCVLDDAPEEITRLPSLGEPRLLALRRLSDPVRLRAVRPLIREAVLIERQTGSCALRALSEAADAHFSLEALYASAMDFEAKERMTQAFCQRLFGG